MTAVPTADTRRTPGTYAFNPASGSRLERLVFQNRRVVLFACLVLTLLLGTVAIARLGLNASFDKMIPRGHPYIQNYLQNRGELRGLGNSLRIVVENPSGTVDDPRYLEALKKIHDEL